MEQAGVMKTLAEPTLTAVSGEQATFRVGGEFNVLNSLSSARSDDNRDGDVQLGYEKIEYGIGLEFKPVVLSPGRISLKVRTSVSEPTNEVPPGFASGAQRHDRKHRCRSASASPTRRSSCPPADR